MLEKVWIPFFEGKVKDDIVKGSGSTVLGAALFVFNGGTTPEAAAEEHFGKLEASGEWHMIETYIGTNHETLFISLF